jgi:hypothetical protein
MALAAAAREKAPVGAMRMALFIFTRPRTFLG